MPSYLTNVCLFTIISYFYRKVNSLLSFSYHHLPYFVFTYCVFLLNFYRNTSYKAIVFFTKIRYDIQVEQPRDLAHDSGQRKLDIFFTESLRILAERLSQSEIGLTLRQICCHSPPERGGSLRD